MPLKLTTYRRSADVPPGLPHCHTFHSIELMRAYEVTPGYTPLMVVASEGGRPVACLLGAMQQYYRHLPGVPLRRCEIYGVGEYFDNPLSKETDEGQKAASNREFLFGEMLKRITDVALTECSMVELRNIEWPMFGYKAFRDNNYFAVSWLRVRNSLHSVERASDRFSSSRLRQVRKGLRNGAEVREARTVDEVREFAMMLRGVYSSKIRRHLPDMAFFRHILQLMVPTGQCKIFLVAYHGRIIGGSVCIYSGTNAYLWFSGGLRKTYAMQYPGILAVWGAMDDAKQRGFRHFEFVDVGLPFRYHGYREFVLRFGGNQLGTRRWFRLRSAWLNRLLAKFFE